MAFLCRRNLRRFVILSFGFMTVTCGYAVLLYIKETIVTDSGNWLRGQDVQGPFESSKGGSVGLNPVEGQACIHPELELWHPALKEYFKEASPLQCAQDENWVYVHNGTFRISKNAISTHGAITCDYSPQMRGHNDFAVVNGPTVYGIADGTPLQSDFFMVRCKASDGMVYKNLHSGIHFRQEFHDRHNIFKMPPEALGMNVLMFGIDSVSRMTWMRNLPKSHKHFTEKMKGMVLNGYNIVGDGTPQALLPILTGQTEMELPEARRGHAGAVNVDGHPWIWKQMRRAGYVTQWGEDGAAFGTFTYRMLGFKYQPVDHYMRPYYIQAEKQYAFHNAYCMGSVSRHINMLNYIREMWDMYPNSPKFSFLFHSELSHDGFSDVQNVDDDLVDFLVDLERKGHLNNTILILMSDHGARFSNVRQTVQGKYEERMPYFGFRFPPWFHEKYSSAMRNFKINQNRLTTPFDIHETFVDMLNYTGAGKGDVKHRGISLFKEIPKERTCKDAGIDNHWCACLNWQSVDIGSSQVILAAKRLVESMNKLTSKLRSKCSTLSVKEITSAGVFLPHKNLLKFLKSSDLDGRMADLSDDMTASEMFYQITLTTTPNDGRYEATVKYVPKTDSFVTNYKEISRINRYGNQPRCVMDQFPHLRPYCYCKNQS